MISSSETGSVWLLLEGGSDAERVSSEEEETLEEEEEGDTERVVEECSVGSDDRETGYCMDALPEENEETVEPRVMVAGRTSFFTITC